MDWNWDYDKGKIISAIAIAVIVIGGIVGAGFAIDNNAETELNKAKATIISEINAGDAELEEAISELPTKQEFLALSNIVNEIRADLDAYIEAQGELDTGQQDAIDAITARLDSVEDAIADLEEDLYGDDGIWSLLEIIQDDIDYLWYYIVH